VVGTHHGDVQVFVGNLMESLGLECFLDLDEAAGLLLGNLLDDLLRDILDSGLLLQSDAGRKDLPRGAIPKGHLEAQDLLEP
jgi:hypothetical protein